MSQYDGLTEIALDWAHRYFEHQHDCQMFARTFALRYIAYLGAPKERLQYLSLNKNLEASDTLTNLSEWPNLVNGSDGFQYVGFSLRLSKGGSTYVDERFHIGLQKNGITWTVLWSGMTFIVHANQPEMLDAIFEKIVGNGREQFSGPINAQKRGIGFLPGSSSE